MSIWHRHKWTDWLVVDRGDVVWCTELVGWYLVQQRHCLSCGKTEIDDQTRHAHGARWVERKSKMAAQAPRKDGVKA